MERKIWAFWPDTDHMSDNRRGALSTMTSEPFNGVRTLPLRRVREVRGVGVL